MWLCFFESEKMRRSLLLLLCAGAAISVSSANYKCNVDEDCRNTLRSGAHSLYCSEGACVRLKPSGARCKSPRECASYPFFGALACSEKCASGMCCKFVPTGGECSAARPSAVSGCPDGYLCVDGESGPSCVPSFSKRWVFGPILSILGNILINIGLNLQKKSYTLKKWNLSGRAVDVFLVGVALYVLGKISGFSSYIFGKQALLAPLGAVGLIANSIFAPMINNEIFTFFDLCAIALVLTGSLIVLSNAGAHRAHSLDELLLMYLRYKTLLWFVFLIASITVLYAVAVVVEENSEWKIDRSVPWLSVNEYYTKNGKVLKYAMLFVYVGLSGMIASFTTLFAKSLGVMIALTFSGKNQFTSLGPYLFISLITVCTFGQIYWLNKALKRYDALLVIPVFYVVWTVLSVITAGIYFKDFAMLTPSQFQLFLLGMLVIFIGSGFLVFRMVGKESPSTQQEELKIKTKQRSDA